MNRRGFIASLLAGVAAVPLLSKLTTRTTKPIWRTGTINGMPMLRFSDSFSARFVAEDYDPDSGIWPDRSGNGNHLYLSNRKLDQDEIQRIYQMELERPGSQQPVTQPR